MKAIAIITSILIVSSLAAAKQKVVRNANGKLTTEMRFNGMNVNGRYNVPGETFIKVEDEKKLNNLLTIPTHFRGRIKQSLTRD